MFKLISLDAGQSIAYLNLQQIQYSAIEYTKWNKTMTIIKSFLLCL